MKNLKKDLKAWLLLCSGLGTILFLMGSTFYVVVAQSLGLQNMMGGESQFTLEHWQAVLSSPVFQKAYIYSVKVSLLGAILSIIVAYPIAMWLRKEMPAKVAIITTLRTPILVPGLVAAFLFVYMPMLKPSFLASIIFCLVKSLEEFSISFVIGSPDFITVPTILYSFLGYSFIRPNAAVVSIILLIPNIILMMIIEKLLKGNYLSQSTGKA